MTPRKDSPGPRVLLAAYLILFSVLAIHPHARDVWFAENLPIVLIVAFLAATYRSFRFSDAAYVMMGFLVYLHTIGGHYTFERVPFGFITDLFGFERNHFDRMAHFTVGFYAFPAAEFLYRKKLVSSRAVLFLFPVFGVFAVAAMYEIFEWLYAITQDPAAGAAVLGSQGDLWDAQKDMLADGLGSVAATALYFALRRPRPDR